MWLPGRTGEREERWSPGQTGTKVVVSPAPSTYLLSPGQIYNLGTGTGYSVLQMVRAMEKASGRKVDHLPCLVTPDSQQETCPLPLAYPRGTASTHLL